MERQLTFSNRAKVATVAAIGALALVFLYMVRDILTPFIWALIVAYVFNPVVTTFSRKTKLHRIWGVALLYTVMAGLLLGAMVFVVPPLRRESEQFGRDVPGLIDALYHYLVGQESIYLWGFQLDSTTLAREITAGLQKLGSLASEYALPVFFGVLELITHALLFLLALFYFLLEADRIGSFLRSLLPASASDEILRICEDIDDVLGRWVRGQLLLVLIMSSATWIGLSLLGVRYALVLALMTGVLETFPVAGPIVAGAIACTVALFQPNPFGWSSITYVAAIAALYFVLRHAEDYFVIPNVIGRIVEFHPLAIIFGVFAGGTLAGILGMFIAAPVLAVLKITMRYLYGKLVDAPVRTEVPVPAEVVEEALPVKDVLPTT